MLAIDDIKPQNFICACVWIDFNQVRQLWTTTKNSQRKPQGKWGKPSRRKNVTENK